jgi:hypothetical protein
VIALRNQKGKTLIDIVDKLSPAQKEITQKLRSLVKKALPEIEETVKWGNITYILKSKNLAWIILNDNHVDFGFFRGAEHSSKFLEGTGKGLRHIKIRESKDINEAEIERLLLEAAKLENTFS